MKTTLKYEFNSNTSLYNTRFAQTFYWNNVSTKLEFYTIKTTQQSLQIYQHYESVFSKYTNRIRNVLPSDN